MVDKWTNRLTGALIWAFLLMAVGGVILGLNWPHTETQTDYDSYFGSSTEEKEVGSVGGTVVGAVIASFGELALLLAIVGFGVKWGTLAARDDPKAKPKSTSS